MEKRAPAFPMIIGSSMIPRASSKPKVFRGARFTALTYPANTIQAAVRVKKPTLSEIAARRLKTASSQAAIGVCAAKYQLQCHG